MNKFNKKELLLKFGFKEGEEHHFKKARKEYICNDCKQIINKGDFYFAELSTLPIGYRKICNVVAGRKCLICVEKRIQNNEWLQDRALPEKGV